MLAVTCGKEKWPTFSTAPHERQVCLSHLSSAPSAVSWSLFPNEHWPAERPVSQEGKESNKDHKQWDQIWKRTTFKNTNHCDFIIPSPSTVHNISQWRLRISQLSVSVLWLLSWEILCPVLPSQSKRRWSLSDHQSPSFARSGFSPKSGKDRTRIRLC